MAGEKQIVSELQGLRGLVANSIGMILEAEAKEIDLLTNLLDFMKSNAKKQAVRGAVSKDKGKGASVKSVGGGILKGLSFKELSDNLGNFAKGLLLFAKASAKGAPKAFTFFISDLRRVMTQNDKLKNPKQIIMLYGAMGDAIKAFGASLGGFARGLLWFFIPAKLGADKLFIRFISELMGPKVMQKLNPKKAREAGRALDALGDGIKSFALGLAIATLAMVIGGPGLLIIVPAIMLVFGVFSLFSKRMKQIRQGAHAIRDLSLGLLYFTGALILMRFVRAEDMLTAVGVIAVFSLFVLAMSLVSKLLGGMKKMKDTAISVMWMSLGLVTFTLAMVVMKLVTWQDILKTMVTVGIMALMVYIMGESKDVKSGAIAFMIISISLVIVALAVKMFEPIEWDTIGKMIACLAGVTLAVYVVGQNLKSALEGAFGVLIVSASMIVLGFAAGYWQSLNIQDETLIQMGLALAGITVALVALGLVGPAVMLGAAALAIVAVSFSGAILILSLALGQFKKIGWTEEETKSIESVLVRIPAAVGKGFWAGGGPLLVFAAGGLLATSFALRTIVDALDRFKKSGVTSDIATEAGKVVGGFIAAVREPIEAIGKGGGLFKMSDFEKGINSVDGLGELVSEIAEGVLAASRMEFKSLDGSIVKVPHSAFVTVGQNVSAMINALKEPIMEIGRNSKPPESTGLLGALGMGMLLPDDNDFRQGMKAVHGLGSLISEIAKGVLDMVSLEFKKMDGTPVQVKHGDFITVGNNVSAMIDSLKSPIMEIGRNSKPIESKGLLGLLGLSMVLPDDNDFRQGMQAISGLGGLISSIADAVLKMVSLEFKKMDGTPVQVEHGDFITVGNNVAALINALKDPISEIGRVSKPREMRGPLGWLFGDIVNAVFPQDTDFERGMESVGGLGALLSGLAEGVKTFGMGEFPNPDDPKGPKINALQLAPRVGEVAGALIKALMTPIGEFGGSAEPYKPTGVLGWVFGNVVDTFVPKDNEFKKGMEAVGGLGGLMSGIAKAVETFGSGYIPDPRDPSGKKFIPVKKIVPKMVRVFYMILLGMSNAIKQYAQMDKDAMEDAEVNVQRLANFIKSLSGAVTEVSKIQGLNLDPKIFKTLSGVPADMKQAMMNMVGDGDKLFTAAQNMVYAKTFYASMKSGLEKAALASLVWAKSPRIEKDLPKATDVMNTAMANFTKGAVMERMAPNMKTFQSMVGGIVTIAKSASPLTTAANALKSISESLVNVLTSLSGTMTEKLKAMSDALKNITEVGRIDSDELEKNMNLYEEFMKKLGTMDSSIIEKMKQMADAQLGGMKSTFEKFQETLEKIEVNTNQSSNHLETIVNKKAWN